MPRPRDLTPEQARAEGERHRAARKQADRLAAPLFAQQLEEGGYDWVELEFAASEEAAERSEAMPSADDEPPYRP